ncbi:hypothetical protein B0H16DRAFT_1891468 [Mycena metata]|uniref:Uncharacterized protein n=1 Tax=Mycena metata TaxID=1033252 RepID=A0AAD7MYL0_9AGAR|nr:hypothetical protein B0H16DRAFT_1891468 [Mycena metata]
MANCIPSTAFSSPFKLMDFQGHFLNLAFTVNPVISQIESGDENEQWTLFQTGSGGPGGVQLLSAPLGSSAVGYDSNLTPDPGPLFMQALVGGETATPFRINCLDSTHANFIDVLSSLALTAWAAESGSTISPVTFETFTNRSQQVCALKSLSYNFSSNFPFFTPTRFPRLCDCQIPFCTDTAAFLRLHPTLVKVAVLPRVDIGLGAPTWHVSQISLPFLRDFSGPASVARQVVPHSPLEAVTLSWNSKSFEQMYHHVLGAFLKTQEPLRVMSNLVNKWDPALLLAIAKHLPQGELGIKIPDGFYDVLKTAILNPPHLRAISCTRATEEAPPTVADLVLEFSVLRELGSRSATLHLCTFASNTTWCRINANFWYPAAASKNLAESEWRMRWLVGSVLEQCWQRRVKRLTRQTELTGDGSLTGIDSV